MKQVSSLFIALLLPLTACFQTTAPAAAGSTGGLQWSVGISATGNYTYRQFKVNNVNVGDLVAIRNNNERATFKPAGALRLRAIGPKWFWAEVQTGITVLGHSSQKLTYTDITGNPIGEGTYSYQFHYWNTGVLAGFRRAIKGTDVFAGAGLSVDYMYLARSITKTDFIRQPDLNVVNDTGVILNPNRIQPFAVAHLGIVRPLKERLSLCVAAEFRYGLVPIAEAPILQRNYATGLTVGVNWKI